MRKRLVLIGGGGFAKEVAEVAVLTDYEIVGHVADGPGVVDAPYLGSFDWLAANRSSFDVAIIAFGAVDRYSLKRRSEVIARLAQVGFPFATLVSPHARVAAGATVGAGTYVGHNAIINPAARVGCHVIINVSAIVSHDVVVGDRSVVAPAAFLAGNSQVGEASLIGPAAQVLGGKSVGNGSLVAVGVIVFDDVADGMKILPAELRT